MTRTLTRASIAVLLGTGLALAAPSLASAHVGVSPDAVAPGSSALVSFSIGHGCEGSPTTALRISMPDGLTSVSPTFDGVWDVSVERRDDDGLVDTVTFTARTPIPNDLRGAVSMQVGVSEDAAGPLVFPVEQQCEVGVNEWTEVAESGRDPHDLDSPAPVIAVDETMDAAAHGHGHDDSAETEETGAAEAAPSGTPGAAPGTALGTALGGAGLVAGIAALVISILALRRRA